MARFVLVVGVVVLLALGGWSVLVEGDRAPLLPTPSTAAVPAGAAMPVGATAGTSPASPDPERTRVPGLAVADVPSIPSDAQWVDVLVLDKQTKQPVAAAEALWWDETVHQQIAKLPKSERGPLYGDQDLVGQRWGRRGRSDRDGKLRVHLGKSWTILQVRYAGHFGNAVLPAGREPPKDGYRVLLEMDCTVRVHVVDSSGQPAVGVGLSLEAHDPEQALAMTVGGEMRTDADGMATFAHVQQRRTVSRGSEQGQPVARWRLFVCIPGLELPPILVDAVQVPSEPIEVQLPPTGRLRAKVTLGGQPMPGLDVRFHVGPKDDFRAINSGERAGIDPDGWARFRHVPLGKTLFVRAEQSAGSCERDLPGPTLPGQEVEIAFDLAGESIVITGRMLRDDGQPLVDQNVSANFDATISMGDTHVQTDAAGRFVWWVGNRRPDRGDSMRLNRLVFDWRSAGSTRQRVEVPPFDLVVGTNDLGDLRLGVAELVVSGRFAFDTPGVARTRFEVTQAEEPRRPSGPERWRRVDGLQIEVHDDGRFEVRGTRAPGRQRIEVHGTHHLPVAPVEFAVGTNDLVIPVQRGGTLQASCLLPDDVQARMVHLRLQPRDPAQSNAKSAAAADWPSDPLLAQPQPKADESTPYVWAALPTGTYTLRVEAAGFAEPLLLIPDVVLPTPDGGDPRLQGIDLRPRMTTLRLRVVGNDAEGARDLRPTVFLLPQADDQEWQGVQVPGREIVLPVPKRAIDLLVACDACQPVTLRGVVGTATATLAPWPTMQVTFQGLEALPRGAQLLVSARRANAGQRDQRRYRTEWSGGGLDQLLAPPSCVTEVKDGVASLQVGEGVHTLSVYVSLGAGGSGRRLQQLTPNELVAGAPGTVQLSADEIRSVVAELQQQAAKEKEAK